MEEEKKIEETLIDDQTVDEIPELEELTPEELEARKDKKIKNLISVSILLGGLFVGSLFVDIVQLFKGGGFSQHALSQSDVFNVGGKTWVAYAEPIVKVQVFGDEACGDACKPDEVLVGLRRVMPTMLTEKIDVNSDSGKALVQKLGIKTIPAFAFSKDLENVDLFSQAQSLFEKRGDVYVLKTAEVGVPVGKYITPPSISSNDIAVGSNEAKVKVVIFGNFMSPVDKTNYADIMNPMLKDYGDKIQLVYKNYVPPTTTQGVSAALGATCANEQGKFLAYEEKLFANQSAWAKAKDASPLLKAYALQVGLNGGDFNKCLDSKKYQDLLTQSVSDGQGLGLQSTPSIFIGSDLQAPAAKYEDIKKVLDEQLSK